MFGTLTFSDAFSVDNGGILPQSLATGTTSGSAIPLGGGATAGVDARKRVFILTAASGTASGTINLYLATSTASNGTFASISATSPAALVSLSLGSQYTLILDTRNEAFADLGTGALWVKPVVVLAGVAVPMALLVLDYLPGHLPASKNDAAAGQLVTRTLFY
jgi:hypothetical protein